jgi:hypothetical protein
MRKNVFFTSLFFIFLNLSGNVGASTLSATGLSLEEAESSLAKKAEGKGGNYKIIGAHYGNYVYLIARMHQ